MLVNGVIATSDIDADLINGAHVPLSGTSSASDLAWWSSFGISPWNIRPAGSGSETTPWGWDGSRPRLWFE